MNNIVSMSDAGQAVNAVFNIFLNLEPLQGVPLRIIVGFGICLGAVLSIMLNRE